VEKPRDGGDTSRGGSFEGNLVGVRSWPLAALE
jgi:hypothetical protein